MFAQTLNFSPSSESSYILGIMIPGVSIIKVGGSCMILNPVMFLVIHGTPPTLAPLFFEWLSPSSFLLKELIIVDFPTLGIPPIMTHAPTVLNYGLTFYCINVRSLLTFCPFFVLMCIMSASGSVFAFNNASVLFSFARSILFTTISLLSLGCFSLISSISSLFYDVNGIRASLTSINRLAFLSSSSKSISAFLMCPGNQLIFYGKSLNSCLNTAFILIIKLINIILIIAFWMPSLPW